MDAVHMNINRHFVSGQNPQSNELWSSCYRQWHNIEISTFLEHSYVFFIKDHVSKTISFKLLRLEKCRGIM